MAETTFFRRSSCFSRKVARRSTLWSRTPPSSPAEIMATMRGLNSLRAFMAALKEKPPSTPPLTRWTESAKRAFGIWPPRMSRALPRVTPALIMAESWRKKTTLSLRGIVLTFRSRLSNGSSLPEREEVFSIRMGKSPRCRMITATASWLSPGSVPSTIFPSDDRALYLKFMFHLLYCMQFIVVLVCIEGIIGSYSSRRRDSAI